MKLVSAMAALFLLGACAQQGNSFDIRKVGEFVPGQTTQQDAIEKLGKPTAITSMPDGGRLLQWQYAFGTGIGIGGGSHAAIAFDRNGLMTKVTHLSSTGAAPDLPTLQSAGRPKFGVNFVDAQRAGGPSSGHQGLKGAQVVIVVNGSVAEKAGVLPGDVITSFGTAIVTDAASMLAASSQVAPGLAIPITVLRGDKDIRLTAQF